MRHPYRESRAEVSAPRRRRNREIAVATGVVVLLAVVRCVVAGLRGEWFSSEVALAVAILAVAATLLLRSRRST
jgi:hypothetical protein